MRKVLTVVVYVNAAILITLSLYLFLIPAATVIRCVRDPGLYTDAIPPYAFKWHRALSPKYEKWARARVQSGTATGLTTANISGTEWPLFGSVFYLWATEALQQAAEENPSLGPVPPKEYARGAIEAAAALVADPGHAHWVIQHWGDDYLERENLFYRMLLISALTSYQKLLGDSRYEVLLREQVESLSTELNESPYGLLDDYPGQCYPVDIAPAIAAVRRADAVLATDHRRFAARAVRGFQDTRLDAHTGLPAYRVRSKTGRALDSARGVGLSFILIWAPELWPETARRWYALYENQFWQQGLLLAGFREFPKDIDLGWFNVSDVDAGPVVGGYGAAASAFGVGAARAMGRMDHAYKLGAQAVAVSWPLPGGGLLVPRLLSNFSDAPYLGEAATLFALTRRPVLPVQARTETGIPGMVYVLVFILMVLGSYEIVASVRKLRQWRRGIPKQRVPRARLQAGAWCVLLGASVISWAAWHSWAGVVFLLPALVLPMQRKRRNDTPARTAERTGPGPPP